MRPIRLFLFLAACAVSLSGCQKLDDKAFGDRVHAYLLDHPEVLQEVENKLQARQQDMATALAKLQIPRNRAAIEHDPSDYVANPNGKITVTEFYDYRCPYCSAIAHNVLALIHDNPDIRFVFKDFIIHGDVAAEAAAGAMMVKQNGGDFLGLYRDLLAAKGLDQNGVEQILRAHGVDPASLVKPPFAQEAANRFAGAQQLAAKLGVDGTPGFVVGDRLVEGADMNSLNAAIAAARAGKP
jgi:protein-disulfide isomerase